MMGDSGQWLQCLARRHFLRRSGTGMGAVALAGLMNRPLFAGYQDTADRESGSGPTKPHFTPKAKSLIFLFMDGGPSQLDLFDYKPKLKEFDQKPIPEQIIKGERFAFIKGVPQLLGSPFGFKRHGKSGAEVSSLLPHLSTVMDEIAVIKSMVTDQINYAPAQLFMDTGSELSGRPSMGSWLTYGLGSENQDLPGYVVLLSGGQPSAGKSSWGSGFLPGRYQGVEFRSQGDPVLFVSNPEGIDSMARRRSLDVLRDLNEMQEKQVGDPEISTRIAAYELAFRMQTSVPELTNVAAEPAAIREMYGVELGKASFASNCLLARRLVERGVRFVELYLRGWDTHGSSAEDDILQGLPECCREMDRPVAALIKDLKQRGLLDTTLVVWGGEFGRTPMNEKRDGSKFLGRDHHPRAFTMWAAGGGIRPGITLGATDELGYHVVEDKVHVHDLHATLLHLMGIDHTRLTYRYQGRDFRLTDVHGEVVKKLLT